MSTIFEQMFARSGDAADYESLFAPEPDEPLPPQWEADEPTGHPPGSDGKVRVMAERFGRGLHLHHLRDVGTCTSLPVAVEGKTYTQAMPGLSLRKKENGSQKGWFVGTRLCGVWVGKHFNITKYEEAVAYLEQVNRGVCSDLEEVYEELLNG